MPSEMELMVEDPVLGPKMLSLLSKELKAARRRVEELELKLAKASQLSSNHDVWKERAEGAELELNALRKDFEEVKLDNRLLRASLEDLKDNKAGIKQEAGSEILNITPLKQLVDKAISTDQVEIDNGDKEFERAQVEKYRTKYQAQKAARKEMTETCKNLEEKLSRLQADNEEKLSKLTQTTSSEVGRQADLHGHGHLSHSSHMNLTYAARTIPEFGANSLPADPSWDDLNNFMMRIPKCATYRRLPYQELRPICHRSMDLKTYLATDPDTSKYSDNFLYLPDLLFWCSDKTNALAIGPIHVFDESQNSWSTKSIFEGLYDKTFCLFEQRKEFIFYVGTYKAINFREWYPHGTVGHGMVMDTEDTSHTGHAPLPFKCVSSLMESTIINSQHNTVKSTQRMQRMTSFARGLYVEGVLRVEPLGLRSVGFDNFLYQNLTKKFHGNQSVVIPQTTRPPASNENRPQWHDRAPPTIRKAEDVNQSRRFSQHSESTSSQVPHYKKKRPHPSSSGGQEQHKKKRAG